MNCSRRLQSHIGGKPNNRRKKRKSLFFPSFSYMKTALKRKEREQKNIEAEEEGLTAFAEWREDLRGASELLNSRRCLLPPPSCSAPPTDPSVKNRREPLPERQKLISISRSRHTARHLWPRSTTASAAPSRCKRQCALFPPPIGKKTTTTSTATFGEQPPSLPSPSTDLLLLIVASKRKPGNSALSGWNFRL